MASAAGTGVKIGTKKGGETLEIDKSMVNIWGDGMKGAAAGIWQGSKVGGVPIAFAGGVFGLINGLTAGEIFEATGFNHYVDNVLTQTSSIISDSFKNLQQPTPVCNQNNQCMMP